EAALCFGLWRAVFAATVASLPGGFEESHHERQSLVRVHAVAHEVTADDGPGAAASAPAVDVYGAVVERAIDGVEDLGHASGGGGAHVGDRQADVPGLDVLRGGFGG